MMKDYYAALQYVQDYFMMDYKKFISKYFKGERAKDIDVNLTQSKYNELFGSLSSIQKEIISDKESRRIVVAAGPGSGKTRVLVHKLASLLLLEDVKHEQMLMLTFSRAAATEFKQRLIQLIGNAAHFVDIKTFHSYCFELLGRTGNLDDSDEVVVKATQMINNQEVEPNRIRKSVLVIDEAQDMSGDEYNLVKALMNANEDMRVIAVGDDDQNIFEFRGSDSKYLRKLTKGSDARLIEMTENYRSSKHIDGIKKLISQGKNSQAIKQAKAMLAKSPDDYIAHYYLGKAYLADNRSELALMEYKTVNQTAIFGIDLPELDFRKELSALYSKYHLHEAALKEYLLLTKLEPSNAENFYNAGFIYDNQGHPEVALGFYQKAIALNKRHAKAHAALGLVLYRSKQLFEAKKEIDLAIQMAPDVVSNYYYLGKILKGNKDDGSIR